MIPAYNQKRCAAFPFETGIHFRRNTDFFPEEDTTKSYSGFEPTQLQAEGHSHHTGWVTLFPFGLLNEIPTWTSKNADAASIRSARILRLPTRTANATEQPSPATPYNRASDSCSPYQGFLDRADSNSSLPLSGNGNDTDMANLPTDMELELALSQRNSTRLPSPQPQLTPCEQLKFNKA
ncbi:hypothetical protein TNCV_2935811 [Trichonephila clavipes]|nr:hypothetical protein TNCV_2935811 [Trichonephila clavipes]